MIYLTGFMGCGKSYVMDKVKNERPDIKCVDTDKLIESTEETAIAGIFAVHGEKYFRELEYKMLLALTDLQYYSLVALGGGTLTFDKSRELVKKTGQVMFINTPFEFCYERIHNDANRPNANKKTKQELFEMYQKRYRTYKNAADYNIRSGKKVIKKLLEIL
jgi:shikimate kinase